MKNEYLNIFDGKPPVYGLPFVGKNDEVFRTIKFWVGTGYTGSFLQKQDEFLNWHLVG